MVTKSREQKAESRYCQMCGKNCDSGTLQSVKHRRLTSKTILVCADCKKRVEYEYN